MRLAALHLKRFGHFTDHALSLPAGVGPDFHIILGANEAGKSTMVEGYLNLLYGIPARTSYAFQHDRDTLEVSAVLEDDGGSHALTRRRRASNSLFGADGSVLPDAVLQTLLQGVTQEMYRSLYCLDDDTIEQGGEDILASKGELGQLLYFGASGRTKLNEKLEEARHADRAFHVAKGPGKNSSFLAAMKKDDAALDRRIKDADLTAPEYRRLRDAAKQAADVEAAARTHHANLVREREALRTKCLALPIKTELDAIDAARSVLGPQPALDAGVPDELAALVQDRAAARTAIRTRQDDLQADLTARASLVLDPRAEGLADALTALEDVRRRAKDADEDLPKRRLAMDEFDRFLARCCGALGVAEIGPFSAADLDLADRSVQAEARAQAELETAIAERATAQETLDRLQKSDQDNAREGSGIDADALAALLRQEEAHRLCAALENARDAVSDTSRRVREVLAALTLGGRVFNDVPRVALTAQGARELALNLANAERAVASETDRLVEERKALAKAQAQIKTLNRQGSAISDAAFGALLAERDQLWQAHLAALSRHSAGEYANARDQVDQAAAARLADAARLSHLRQQELVVSDLSADVQDRQVRLDAAKAEHTALQTRLSHVLGESDLPSDLSAEDFVGWLSLHAAATEAMQAARSAETELAAATRLGARAAQGLASLLDTTSDDLVWLVREAEQQIREAEAQAALRAQADQTLAEAEADVLRRGQAVTEAQAAYADAKRARAKAWAALGTDLPGGADRYAALSTLRLVLTTREKREDLEYRITAMETNWATFQTRVAALAEPWPDLAGKPALEQVAALDRQAEAYQRAQDAAQTLDAKIVKARQAIARDQKQVDAIERRAAMIALAWPDDARPAGVEAVLRQVQIVQKAQDLDAASAEKTHALLHTLGLETKAEAEAALDGITEGDLRAEEERLAPDLDLAETDRDEAIKAKSLADRALQEVSGDGDAAQLQQDRAVLRAEILARTEEALTRRLGLILAERALAKYKEAHRGDMLAATEAAFVKLTNGAYSGLSAQQDGPREILIAQRAADKRTLPADEKSMSKGTRFQMYLALRLAGYHQMAQHGRALPFLCDDIFETFDEARTAAACRLLAQIGELGQALYFTHHAHVADIARKECPSVQIHPLARNR